jgi:hypothetical protein
MPTLNHAATPFVPRTFPGDTTTSTPQDHVITTSALLAALSLPKPEVPKFNGDLTNYKTFMAAFDVRVASRTSSSADKLYFLDQHMVGEPKMAISGCFHLDPESGYVEARRLLDKEYGDPYKISMVYLSKLNEWPVVKQDDSVGLKKLSMFLTNCCYAMKYISDMHVLNHIPNMQSIIQKLPFYLQNKWREQASRMRQMNQRTMLYQDLVDFVAAASDTANDPVYGRAAMTRHNTAHHSTDVNKPPQSHLQGRSKQQSISFATGINPYTVRDKNNAPSTCVLCHHQHDLEDCNIFINKNMDDKRAFIKDKRLCFGCFGSDHMSKGCMHRHKCKKCDKRHPTSLHIDGFQMPKPQQMSSTGPHEHVPQHTQSSLDSIRTNNQDAPIIHNHSVSTTACTATDNTTVMHAILPVKVYQKGSNKVITTYCFYDNGSSGCFITDTLFEKLEATGIQTRLQLRTMNGTSCNDSNVVQKLVITDINGLNDIEMPKTFTRERIPVNHQQIPRSDMIERWPHLQHIAMELPAFRPDLEIGILVGNNCPMAHEPLEIIPTDGSHVFATRLRHGWTVHGSVKPATTGQFDVTCNRIIVQESFKEIMTPASAMHMLELDFNDQHIASYPDEKGMSREDIKFLAKTEQKIVFKDCHYTIPLPFREDDVIFQNNRTQAIKRALWQRSKMNKDEKYRTDYVEFVTNLLDHGYAKRVSSQHIITSSVPEHQENICSTTVPDVFIETVMRLMDHFSSWYTLYRVAVYLKVTQVLRDRVMFKHKHVPPDPTRTIYLTSHDINDAQMAIFRIIHKLVLLVPNDD